MRTNKELRIGSMTGHLHPTPDAAQNQGRARSTWIGHAFSAWPGRTLSNKGLTGGGSKVKGRKIYEYEHKYLLYKA